MRWRDRRGSNNIEDRRGDSGPSGIGGLGGGGSMLRLLPMVYRILGVKGIVLLGVGLLTYGLFTGNLGAITGLGAAQTSVQSEIEVSEREQELADFISVMLADSEQVWEQIFTEQGASYQQPTLVLFRSRTQSACGLGQAATGPFYCPSDQQIYIDLSFFDQLANQLNAPGDFAQAYVLAHEVGHHIQTIMGLSNKVHSLRKHASKTQANQLSVLQELQADCYAGVWAFHANKQFHSLEAGDIDEGLRAASAIGDDALQEQAGQDVRPDSFTHGSSEQRVQWFNTGFETGQMKRCDTFAAL